MPRPTSKNELIQAAETNFAKLIIFVDALPKPELDREFAKKYLNRNVRDVLAHLHHWHLMMLDWYKIGMNEKEPAIPAQGYTWKTVPELNRKIQAQYSSIDLDQIRSRLNKSHQSVCQIMRDHSNEELFTKKKYRWTGSTSLGSYLISASSSHYDWALKLIKKGLKNG